VYPYSQCQTARHPRRVGKIACRILTTWHERACDFAHACPLPRAGLAASPTRGQRRVLPCAVLRDLGRAFAHPTDLAFCCSLHLSFLSLHSTSFFAFRCPFARGVRSAGGAWMLATHPDRQAMTGLRTPHRSASPSRARLAFIAHPRLPLAAFDMPPHWASQPDAR